MNQLTPTRARVAHFNHLLADHRDAQTWRSARQLAVSTGAFLACWYLAYSSLSVGYWLTLLLAVPTAGFLARLFMLQHDCGHGSFFRSRRVCSFVGHWLGVLTLLPYEAWRRAHAVHHANSGNLELRGLGDIDTLTVDEYVRMPRRLRVAYRLYRHPLGLFLVGAPWYFIVKQRYPYNLPRSWKRAWRGVWLTNASIAGVVGLLWATIGWRPLLLVHGPVVMLESWLGLYLFYVQHQLEEAYWEQDPAWDYYDAALKGSSHLVLPAALQWMTASIGLHHIHHLSPRIPNYRLQEALDANPELEASTKLTLRDTASLFRLSLWDRRGRRLIGFRELAGRDARTHGPGRIGWPVTGRTRGDRRGSMP